MRGSADLQMHDGGSPASGYDGSPLFEWAASHGILADGLAGGGEGHGDESGAVLEGPGES